MSVTKLFHSTSSHHPQQHHSVHAPSDGSLSNEMSSTCDDYGEEDISLRSYKSDKDTNCGVNLSRDEANDLLFDRLNEFVDLPSEGNCRPVCSSCETDSCSFIAAGWRRIDLKIQSDTRRILISTVIHKVDHGYMLAAQGQQTGHRFKESYSLMTKMMKYNALLASRPSFYSGRVLVCDGVFVFFATMAVSDLVHEGILVSVLQDFIPTAVDMNKDFMHVTDDVKDKKKESSRYRRGRFLLR